MMNIKKGKIPKYKCHKEVRAFKIKEVVGRTDPPFILIPIDESLDEVMVDVKYVVKHRPKIDGYYVLYDDGYESFSPAEAFEDGYTLLKE